MALTLAESAKLAADMVQAGVIETIIKEEHVLDQLPFIDVVGNSFGGMNALLSVPHVRGIVARSAPCRYAPVTRRFCSLSTITGRASSRDCAS